MGQPLTHTAQSRQDVHGTANFTAQRRPDAHGTVCHTFGTAVDGHGNADGYGPDASGTQQPHLPIIGEAETEVKTYIFDRSFRSVPSTATKIFKF